MGVNLRLDWRGRSIWSSSTEGIVSFSMLFFFVECFEPAHVLDGMLFLSNPLITDCHLLSYR